MGEEPSQAHRLHAIRRHRVEGVEKGRGGYEPNISKTHRAHECSIDIFTNSVASLLLRILILTMFLVGPSGNRVYARNVAHASARALFIESQLRTSKKRHIVLVYDSDEKTPKFLVTCPKTLLLLLILGRYFKGVGRFSDVV